MKDNRLYKMFKYDHPETVGETDQCFDTGNYNDWLQEYVGKLEAKLLMMKLSERQTSTEADKQPDSKALHIADVMLSLPSISEMWQGAREMDYNEFAKWYRRFLGNEA